MPVTDPSFADFMARSPCRPQGDTGLQNWLNDLYNTGFAVPVLTSINPNTIAHGAANTVFTATGSSFVKGCALYAGATKLTPTTFLSSTSLQATIPAASLAAAGTIQISVQNPDARSSANVAFTVT